MRKRMVSRDWPVLLSKLTLLFGVLALEVAPFRLIHSNNNNNNSIGSSSRLLPLLRKLR